MKLSKEARSRIQFSENLMKISHNMAKKIEVLALKRISAFSFTKKLTKEMLYVEIVLAEHILEYVKNR